jgi:hypothetical protein
MNSASREQAHLSGTYGNRAKWTDNLYVAFKSDALNFLNDEQGKRKLTGKPIYI